MHCSNMRAETPPQTLIAMQPLRDAELKIDALHLLEWAVKSKLHADCLTITALTSVRCRKIALALSEVNGCHTGSFFH